MKIESSFSNWIRVIMDYRFSMTDCSLITIRRSDYINIIVYVFVINQYNVVLPNCAQVGLINLSMIFGDDMGVTTRYNLVRNLERWVFVRPDIIQLFIEQNKDLIHDAA